MFYADVICRESNILIGQISCLTLFHIFTLNGHSFWSYFVNVGATAYECDDQQIAVNADIRLPPYLSLADVGPLGINWYATNVLRSNSSAIIPDSWVKGGGGRGGCLTIQMGQKCFKLPFHTHFSDSNDSHFPSQTVTYPIKSESLQN